VDESERVLHLFEALSISGVANGRAVSLVELDRQLQEWHEQEGISMKKFKGLIRAHAICLGDCKAYHSQKALKQALLANRRNIISREKAKQYKYVRQYLTILCLIACRERPAHGPGAILACCLRFTQLSQASN